MNEDPPKRQIPIIDSKTGKERLSEPVAVGQRYAWPSDGTHHIWVIGADGLGTLSLSDGSKRTETVQLTGCKADAAS